MGLLDSDYGSLQKAKPKRSDNIQPRQELNYDGLLDAATNIPIAGDVLSGALAVRDYLKGDKMGAAMNALGVLPFVSAGMVKGTGKVADALKDGKKLTEFEQRHEIARQNAVKMLGLPEDNTAMDRARAMGAVDAYHGTASDVQQLDPKMFGSSTGAESAKRAWWAVDEPSTARGYAEYAANQAPVKRLLDQADKLEKKGDWDGYDRVLGEAEALEARFANNTLNGQNIMPLKIIPQNPKIMDAGGAEFTDLEGGVNNLLRQAKFGKNDVAIIKNLSDDVGFNGRPATHYGVLNPAAVRSRFAAFDPARINEPDMMGYADPRLLGLIGASGLLGSAAYKYGQDK